MAADRRRRTALRRDRPVNPDLIGQAAWYDAKPASGVGAFVVTITVGWGDCPAGCIDRHTWTYAVAPDGTVNLLSEGGDPVPPEAFPEPPQVTTGIVGHGHRRPDLPGPAARRPELRCLARSRARRSWSATRRATEVGTMTTLPDGSFAFALPAGEYVVQGRPVEGLMGTPAPMPVTVAGGIARHHRARVRHRHPLTIRWAA